MSSSFVSDMTLTASGGLDYSSVPVAIPNAMGTTYTYVYNTGLAFAQGEQQQNVSIQQVRLGDGTAVPWYNAMEQLGRAVFSAPSSPRRSLDVVQEPSRSMLKRLAVEVPEVDLADEDKKLAIDAESVLGYKPLRRALHMPGELRRVLAKLELAVLDQESVDEYKAQMAAHFETTGKMLAPTWRLTRLENYTQEVPKFVLRKAVEIKRELPEAMFFVDQLAVDPFMIVSLSDLPDFVINQKRTLNPELSAYLEVWSEPKFEATM